VGPRSTQRDKLLPSTHFLPKSQITLGSRSPKPPLSRAFGITLGVICACLFFACRDLKQELAVEVLRVGNEAEPATLDPHQATGQIEMRVLSTLVEGLVVRTSRPGEVKPGLATSWELDSTGRQYRFHLRRGFWSDGSRWTAQSIVRSWQHFVDPKTASEYSSLLKVVKNGDAIRLGHLPVDSLGIGAVDDTTLLIKLEWPAPFFLDLCAFEPFALVPVDSMTKFAASWTHPGRFVGTGPFRLVSWKANQLMELEKNPFYWDTAHVALRKILIRPIEDQLMAFQMFRNFEIDWSFNIPPSRLQQARKLPEFFSAPMYGTYYFIVNCRKPGFDSPLLRKALAYAIDRNQIVEKVLKGIGQEATAFVPGTSNYSELQVLSFDPTKARAFLKQAGFSASHPPPPLQILFNNSETHKNIAEVVSQMWKTNLGLDVELVHYEWKVYLENTKSLNYQAVARASWIGDFSDPISFLELYTTGNGNNRTGYSNLSYDSLIAASWQQPDAQKRMQVLHSAETLLMEDMPIIPLYHYVVTELRTPRLQHADPSPLGMYAWKNLRLGPQP
jgi:oligopeptide transport system substrate-binding protein